MRYGSYVMGAMCWVVLFISILYLPTFFASLGRTTNVLRILTFGSILDPAYIQRFEKATGITVELSYYVSNEELHAKLKKIGGKGYDLIVPSDYTVSLLLDHGLLKRLDHGRMPFLHTINPLLLHHHFDCENHYSVPFEWELYGIGYNKQLLGHIDEPHWAMIFRDPKAYKIVMVDDPVEALLFATQYLYGDRDSLSVHEFTEVENLLKKQRTWVEAYSSMRAGYYLVTELSPLALSTTSYMFNARKQAPHLAFAIPTEGSFITIENFAIPHDASRDELVYKFLNFIYTQDAAIHHFHEYANLPAVLGDEVLRAVGSEAAQLLTMDRAKFKKMRFFKQIAPEAQVKGMWVAVKA